MLWWIGSGLALVAGPQLPIYLEDNHAGAFYFLAEHLELEEEHTLVLIDAHSDASAAPLSDAVRHGIRRVRNEKERGERLEEWRREGRIQANDWLEPLMPRPIARVVWVAAASLGGDERRSLQVEARAHLDGRLEGEPRECGALAERFSVVDLAGLEELKSSRAPLLVSLDLDFFTGMPEAEFERVWSETWSKVLALPNLRAVTIAVSRPWLRDDAEAQWLLARAIEASCSVENGHGFSP